LVNIVVSRNKKDTTIDACFISTTTRLVPSEYLHVTSFLSLSSQLSLALVIQFSIASSDLRPAHLLGLGLLDVADPNESEQTIKVPVLTLERDVE
jgi:hypothetical protein